jgi:hypothetical protein
MDLNTICIGLLILPILYTFYIYYNHREITNPALPKALWSEQVGRSKLIQSKTGDASMFIQNSRRTATKNGGFQKGFMSAAIDYFFISRICPCTKIPIVSCKCKCCEDIDGGYGNTLFSDLYDGGGAQTGFGECTLDGGVAIHGQSCGCFPVTGGDADPSDVRLLYSGGAANEVFGDSCGMDGGVAIHGQSCGCFPVTGGGADTTEVTNLYSGGSANQVFGDSCGMDGGAVVHGQTCECCPNVDGGEGADYLPVSYSGGDANEVFYGKNIDGGGSK